MAQAEHAAGARPFGPPLARGLPILALCVAALAYAWIAIPLTLVPFTERRTWSGGVVGNDFLAFYSAARLAWGHAADAYNLPRPFAAEAAASGTGMRLPFTYPPLFLLYAAPLAAAPYLPALYAWIVATTAPFALVARRLSGLATLLVALSPPVIQNAIDGQNGALTASLFAGGLLLLTRGRPVLAGIAFA
ncbi:MAG TPA: glycosyltransferase 87 family protein, partial [Roseiarcus sp.]|nr:glycosyltransferase 87 family protein [Roseiarcus sp.]